MSLQITFQDVLQSTTAPAIALGTQGVTPDGRVWNYAEVSTGGLAKGSVAVPTAPTAVDNVSSSVDSQNRIVFITKSGAGWTSGAFADGWVVVDDGTGVGQAGRILTNTTDTLQLYPAYALTTALSVADSDITITQNYKVVKSAVTSKLQNAVGIAQIAFAAGSFGWILQKGQGVVAAGVSLTPTGVGFVTGDDTTGQVVLATTAKGTFDEQSLGRVLVVNAAADQLAQVWVEI